MDDAYDNGKIFNFMKTLKIVVFNLIFPQGFMIMEKWAKSAII